MKIKQEELDNFHDNLYFDIAGHAVKMADQIRECIDELGYPYLVPGVTNQIFPIFPDELLAELAKEFVFCEQERVDETHRAIRFCTSWATKQDAVDALCAALRRLTKG